MSLAGSRPELVVIACAVSAGIHGALVPEHFAEGTGAGVGFVVATVSLAAVVVWVTRRSSRRALAAAAALLGVDRELRAGGDCRFPVVHPDPEPLDGLALATKAFEAVGLLAASSLLLRPRTTPILPRPKGTST